MANGFAVITQTCGDIGGLTDHGEIQPLLRADIAIEHRPRGNPDGAVQIGQRRARGDFRQRRDNGPCGSERLRAGFGRVLACREDRQHRVPDEFQHLATVFMHEA